MGLEALGHQTLLGRVRGRDEGERARVDEDAQNASNATLHQGRQSLALHIMHLAALCSYPHHAASRVFILCILERYIVALFEKMFWIKGAVWFGVYTYVVSPALQVQEQVQSLIVSFL